MCRPRQHSVQPGTRQSYQTPSAWSTPFCKSPADLADSGRTAGYPANFFPAVRIFQQAKGGSIDEECEIALLCDGTPDALRSGVTTCDARRSITALLVTALLLVGAVPAVRVACEVKHHPCAQSASIEACCGGEHTLLAASEPAGANSNPVASLSLVGPSSTDIEVSVLAIADDRLLNSSPPTDRSPDLVLLFRDLRL